MTPEEARFLSGNEDEQCLKDLYRLRDSKEPVSHKELYKIVNILLAKISDAKSEAVWESYDGR